MADRKLDLEKIADSITNLFEEVIGLENSPDSGQPKTREDVRARVMEVTKTFIEVRDMKLKTAPVINDFLKHHSRQHPHEGEEAVLERLYPHLDSHFEKHALMTIAAHLLAVGPFRKLKDDTQAKIMEETSVLLMASLSYLDWRSKSVLADVKEQDKH